MKVKFLRSIIAGGCHREEHTTAELDDVEAVALIASGDCIRATQAIETAEANHPEKETAARGKHR